MLIVALGGVMTSIQSGTNAHLAKSLDRSWMVGLFTGALTATVLAVVTLVSREGLPSSDRIAATPWWAWTGGLCGAVYVVSTLFFAQKLGSGVFTGLTVTAGIIASIVMDHFGLVGFRQHTAGIGRILGGALMIGGLVMVSRF